MEQLRLTPAMSSRAAMVLDFITSYFEAHNGVAPSQSEIAAGVGINKDRVKAAIRSLERREMLRRRPGVARGLSLPSVVERAKRDLLAAGYRVDDDARAAAIAPVVTFSTLPMIPHPAHTARGGDGSGDGEGAG